MNMPRMRRDDVGLMLAAVVALVGLLGLAAVVFGNWRPSPGGKPWLVPLLAFLTLLPTSGLMALSALRGRSGPALPRPDAWPIIATAAGAILFFMLVRSLGLFTGSLLSVFLAMWCLTPPPRPLWRLGLLALAAACALWLLFTQLAPILLPRPWLF